MHSVVCFLGHIAHQLQSFLDLGLEVTAAQQVLQQQTVLGDTLHWFDQTRLDFESQLAALFNSLEKLNKTDLLVLLLTINSHEQKVTSFPVLSKALLSFQPAKFTSRNYWLTFSFKKCLFSVMTKTRFFNQGIIKLHKNGPSLTSKNALDSGMRMTLFESGMFLQYSTYRCLNLFAFLTNPWPTSSGLPL